MTLYAGESVEVTLEATYFNGNLLIPDLVTTVVLSIFDADQNMIATGGMSWSESESIWLYLWDTTNVPAGTYVVKVTVNGVAGTKSWEYGKIRLKTPRITATEEDWTWDGSDPDGGGSDVLDGGTVEEVGSGVADGGGVL